MSNPPAFRMNTQLLTSLTSFENYVASTFTAADPPGGSNGVFGSSFSSVNKRFYQKCIAHGFTVASWPLLDMKLPFDPVTNKYTYTFDKFARRAVLSLPDPPTELRKDIVIWWTKYSTLFTAFFDKYGVDVVVSGSLGGMIEQYTTCQDHACVVKLFEDATGLPTYSASSASVFSASAENRSNSKCGTPSAQPLVCLGGDPAKCTKSHIMSGAWQSSAETAPVLLQYKVSGV
jgi:hypothetical protein